MFQGRGDLRLPRPRGSFALLRGVPPRSCAEHPGPLSGVGLPRWCRGRSPRWRAMSAIPAGRANPLVHAARTVRQTGR